MNARAQRVPPDVVVSNPQVYEVTITTTFVVPELTRTKLSAALGSGTAAADRTPLGRPGPDQTGASAITYQPDSGRVQHLSNQRVAERTLGTARRTGGRHDAIEFVSRFRVRSADRTFDLGRSTAKKSDNQHKRPQVRSVDRTLKLKQSTANWSDYHHNLDVITPPVDVNLDSIADEIKKSHPPAEAALEFCKWVTEHIKYDASVPYHPRDLAAILQHKKGHCGHQMTTLEAMCTRAGIPTRTVLGLNLNTPGGVRRAPTRFDRISRTSIPGHKIYIPGSGWVEIDPGQGAKAYFLPAQLIQNSTDFQNYVIWICEDGTWKQPDWEYRDGKWYSPYGIENHRAFRRVEAN